MIATSFKIRVAKYLGVHIDQHFMYLRKLGANLLGPISCKVLCSLYHAYMLPILDYCDVVWSPVVHRIQGSLRVHSRFVSSLTSSNSDLKLSLTERRTFHTAVKVFKILHKLAPPYLHSMFQYAPAVSGRTGRNLLRLFVPSIRTNYGWGSLWFRGTTIWNNLSPTVIAAQYLKLSTLILCNCFRCLLCTLSVSLKF